MIEIYAIAYLLVGLFCAAVTRRIDGSDYTARDGFPIIMGLVVTMAWPILGAAAIVIAVLQLSDKIFGWVIDLFWKSGDRKR